MNGELNTLTAARPGLPGKPVMLRISPQGKWVEGCLDTNVLFYGPEPALRIIPGLIDIHVHGGKGLTFGEHPDRLEEELREYSHWVASSGIIGFVCSIAAPDARQLIDLVSKYAIVLERGLPGAECLGLHLEGPFLSETRRGAFNASWLHNPTFAEVNALIKAGKGWIRQVTIAPELSGAIETAQFLHVSGITAAIGHTDGDYETICKALALGYNHVTHMFNAMSTFSHFAPGAVGAILTSDDVSVELIADGIHVHPGAMKLLLRCLGPERVTLVTDAMAGAGMPDGVYELIGSPVVVKDGQARRSEDGRLAGSTATLNQCVFNMIHLAGATFEQSVSMASANPARVIHLATHLGSLDTGKDASYALVDEQLQVYRTVLRGRVVYDRL